MAGKGRNGRNPVFWRQRDRHQGNGSRRKNGRNGGKGPNGQSRICFESLEPRVLLSGDLATVGVSDALHEGLGQFGVVVNGFMIQEPLLDVKLPLVVRSGGDSLLNDYSVAPTIYDLLSVDLDLNRDGSIQPEEEGFFDNSLDSDGNRILDFSELFLGKFISDIEGYLENPQDLNGGGIDSTDLLAFLSDPARDGAGSYAGQDYAARSYGLRVDNPLILTSDHEVAFQLDFTLTFANELALDLGYQAEELGMVPAATLMVDAEVSFRLQFGALTSGEGTLDQDFFVSVPEGMRIGVTAEDTNLSEDIRIGFLGTEINSGSASMEVNVDAIFSDPTMAAKVGFDPSQYGTSGSGLITALYDLSNDDFGGEASILMRMGGVQAGGGTDAREVRFDTGGFDAGTPEGLADIQSRIQAALDGAGLSVVRAETGTGRLVLKLTGEPAGLDITPLGFSGNELFAGTGNGTLTAASALTDAQVGSLTEPVKFLLSVNHALPVTVTVNTAAASTVDQLVAQINVGLAGAGLSNVTAQRNAGGFIQIRSTLATPASLEVTRSLTVESGISLSDLEAAPLVPVIDAEPTGVTFDGSDNHTVIQGFSGHLLLNIPGHHYKGGELVVYSNGGGESTAGLVHGAQYYVIFEEGASIKLSLTPGGDPIAYSVAEGLGTGSEHRLIDSHFDLSLPIQVKPGLKDGDLNDFTPTATISFDTPTHNPFDAESALDGDGDPLFQPRDGDERFNFGIGLTDISGGHTAQDLQNFANMDASSVIGIFREFGRYLDGLGKGEDFASYGIPFAAADLGDLLDFKDMWEDAILYDDGDDGVDGPDRLLTDVNSALAAAGMSGRLIARAEGGRIQLVAVDPDITAFSVEAGASDSGGYLELGFAGPEDSSGSFPSVTFNPPAGGKIAHNAAIDVTITTSAGVEPAVKVELAAQDTDDNVGVGNDSAGLIDSGNAPLFSTAQELAHRLAAVLGLELADPDPGNDVVEGIDAAYDPGTGDLTYNISLENALPWLEAGANFNLPLDPFDNISSDSRVILGATAGLEMVLGINLLDSSEAEYLQETTTLDELKVKVKTDPAVTGENDVRTIYGRLTEDATFSVTIGSDTYVVTVPAADAGQLGFDNGQTADGDGVLTAAHEAADFAPGLDVTFELTVGTDDPYVIKLPTSGINGSDDNLNLDDLVADLNAALSSALGADGEMVDLSGDVAAGKDPSGTRLTLTRIGGSGTFLAVGSLGAMSDNGSLTLDAGAQELADDVALALTNARRSGAADTDPEPRVDLTSVISAAGENGRLRLASDADFTVTVDSGNPAMGGLGFRAEHQAEPDDPDSTAPVYSLTTTKDVPKLVGRLSDDAVFTIGIEGVEYAVTVKAGEAEANQTVLDLVNDVNRALGLPSVISSNVTQFELTDTVTFGVSVNGGSTVPVNVLPSATNGTAAPVSFEGTLTPENLDENTVSVAGHRYNTGEAVLYSSVGNGAIGGLEEGRVYYVFVVDGDTIGLALTENDAVGGRTVELTAASSGTHTLSGTPNADIEDLVQDINLAIEDAGLSDQVEAESYIWQGQSRILIKAADDSVEKFELTAAAGNPFGLPQQQLARDLSGLLEADSQGDHLVLTSLDGSAFAVNAASESELGLLPSQTSNSDDLVIHLSDGSVYRVDLDGAVTVADVIEDITEQTRTGNLSEGELGFGPTQDAAAVGSELVIAAVNPETVDAVSGLSGYAFFSLSVSRSGSVEDAEVAVPTGSGSGGTLVADIIEALNEAGFEGDFTVGKDGSGRITLTAADAAITAFSLMSLGPVKVQINDAGTGLELEDRTWSDSNPRIFFVEPVNNSAAATQLGIARMDVTRDANQDGDIDNRDADGVIDGAPIKGPKLADRFFLEDAALSADYRVLTPQMDGEGVPADTDGDGNWLDGIDASATVGYVGVSLHGGGVISGEVRTNLDNGGTKGINAITNTRPVLEGLIDGTSGQKTFGQLILDVTAAPSLSIENMDSPDDPRVALTVTSMGDPFAEYVLEEPVKRAADSVEISGNGTLLLVKGAKVTIGLDEATTFTDTADGLDQKAADSFTLDGDQTALIRSGSRVLFGSDTTRVKEAIYDDIEKTTTVTVVDAVLPAVLSEMTVWKALKAEVLESSYDPAEDVTTVTFRTGALADVAIGTLDADAQFAIEIAGIKYDFTVEAWRAGENRTVLDLVDDVNSALGTPSVVSGPLSESVLLENAAFEISVNGGAPVSVVVTPEDTDGTAAPVYFNGETDVDPDSDTITIGTNSFVTGEAVIFSSNGSPAIDGLEEGGTYFIIVEDAVSIRLAKTRKNALYGSAVDLIAGGVDADYQIAEIPNQDIEDLALDVNGAIAGTSLKGAIEAENISLDGESRIRIKAADGSVAVFALTAGPGNPLGLPVSYQTRDLSDTIEAVSRGDRLVLSAIEPEAIFAPGDVDISADSITVEDHGFVTGRGVVYSRGGVDNNAVGTAAGELADGGIYYVIVIDSDTIKIAATEIDALQYNPDDNDTAIDLTSEGSGQGHSLTGVPLTSFTVSALPGSELGFSPLQTSESGEGIVSVTAENELAHSLVEMIANEPPDVSVTTPGRSDVSGLGDLLLFDDIDFNDVLGALSEMSSFLEEFEVFGDLDEPLFLFDRSVSDLMGLAKQFGAAMDKAEANPAGTLQDLEGKLMEAFGFPAGQVWTGEGDGFQVADAAHFTLDGDRSGEIEVGSRVLSGSGDTWIEDVQFNPSSGKTTVALTGSVLPLDLSELTVLRDFLFTDAEDGLAVDGGSLDTFTLAGDRTDRIALGAKVLIGGNHTRVTDASFIENSYTGSDGLTRQDDDSLSLDGDRTGQIVRGAEAVFAGGQARVTDVQYDEGTRATTVTLSGDALPADLFDLTVSFTKVALFDPILSAGLSELTVANDFIDLSLDKANFALRFDMGLAARFSDVLDAALLDVNLLDLIPDVNLADLGRRGEVQFSHDTHGLTVDISGASFILDGDQSALVGPGSKVLFDGGEVRVTDVSTDSFTYDQSAGLARLDGQRFSVEGDRTAEILPGSKAMFGGDQSRIADVQYDAASGATTVILADPVLPEALAEVAVSYTTVAVADSVLPQALSQLRVSFMLTAADHGLAWESGTTFTLSGDRRALIAEGDRLSFDDGVTPDTRVMSVAYDILTETTTVTVSDDAELPAALSEVAVSDEFADLRASRILAAEGRMAMNLDFGIGLGDPEVTGDAGEVHLYDGTVMDGALSTPFNGVDHWVRDLDFRANLGPFSLQISGGSASAAAAFGAGTEFAGRKPVVDVDLTEGSPDISSRLDQVAKAEFPASFNSLDVGTFSFSSNPGLTLPDGFRSDFVEKYTGEKTNLFDNILLAVDGVDLFLAGLQDLLDGEVFGFKLPLIGDQLADGARFIEDLRDDFVDPFRGAIETADEVVTDFQDPDRNIVSGFLFDLLGPGGEDLLKPLQEGGDPQTAGDYIALDSDFSSISDSFIQWNMTIGGTLWNPSAGIGFDIGLPGLNLQSEGRIELEISWELAFGFGISFTDGFYLDISDGDELELNVEVTLPDAALVGTLGFLRFKAEDKDVDGDGDSTHLSAMFGINIINKADRELIAHQDELPPGEDIDKYLDQKLTLPELFGQMSVDFVLGFEAAAELGLTLEVSGDLIGEGTAAGFPSITADFIADFALEKSLTELLKKDDDAQGGGKKKDKTDPFIKTIMDGLNVVAFQNVTLDLGSYVSDVIGPVVDKIQDVTKPIQPVIDVLTEPIPVVSDLGPDLTLLDIAAMAGRVDKRLLYAIADVITLINTIPDPSTAESLMLDFGDYTIYDKSSGLVQAALWSEKYDLAEGTDKLLNDPLAVKKLLSDFDNAMNSTPKGSGKKTKGVLNKMKSAGDFAFPILDDPAQVFGLLTGRPAVLITYDMDPLTFEFEWGQFFSVLGPLGVSINMEFSAKIDFAFGYDTLGIQEFVEGDFKNPLLLLDGFYVSDTDLATGDFGTDVPELVFSGGLYAAAELNLVIARAGVAGGIFAKIEFDLYDPDRDGRVRIREILGNVENEWNYGSPVLAPLAIFDVHGEVWARLWAFLEIDLFIVSFSYEFDITPPVTLLEFDIPFTRPPNLATETGGDLVINAGDNAADRLNYNTSDGSEVFRLWGAQNSLDVTVSAFGFNQKYELGGSTIYISGGEGNDVFDLRGLRNPNITAVIDGGPGDDIIYAGAGTAIIRGGEGNDIIFGGEGDDEIYGGLGADTIYAGAGRDLVLGDEGFKSRSTVRAISGPTDGGDAIFGQGGDDVLIGGGGSDTIDGGDGEDIVVGDGAQVTFAGSFGDEQVPVRGQVAGIRYTTRDFFFAGDKLLGGDGADEIYGGKGDDNIDGGPGGDFLFGEDGFDTIHGGEGWDTIFGDNWRMTEEGFETTFGGDADRIFGDGGEDTIYAGGGGDRVEGGEGGDTIYGGTGADELYGDGGNDAIYGEGDPDLIFGGEGDDTRLDGGEGDDEVRGDAGEDRLFAGLGNDDLNGGQGSDRYILNLRGADNSSITEVFDSGTSTSDTDSMTVNGTDFDDQFLLRAGYGKAFVALLNDFPDEGVYDNVERINYAGLERLVVNGLAGQDRFAVDDVAAEATINGGVGEDFFQVGQLYRSPRAANPEANIAEADQFGTIETTRGWLSSGITQPMTINGGADDDEFVVFHNLAVLTLNGGTGDDLFTIRAFALVGSQDTPRERTDIHGGGGADLIQYAVNAPVNIDGGDGLDTVIVIGTEFADDFVVTKDGVYGAGLNVNFVGIEILRVDGAEGDDRFFVLSTGENFMTEIFGGLGSDTFNMAGDTPPVVSNDLLGHSGVITHSVESVGTEYDGIKVNGISANVADNDEPAIRITQTGDSTIVSEDGQTDTYRVVLTRQPDEDVYVKALAPARTPEEEAMEAFHFAVSSETGYNETDGSATTLHFTPDNWYLPQTVTVSVPDTTVVGPEPVAGAAADQLTAAEGTFEGMNLAGMRVRILSGAGEGQTRIIDHNTGTVLYLTREWDPMPVQTGDFPPTFEVVKPFDDEAVEGVRFGAVNHTVISQETLIGGEEDGGPRDVFMAGGNTLTAGVRILDNQEAASASSNRLTAEPGAFDGLDLTGARVWITSGAGAGQVREIASVSGNTLTVTLDWDPDDVPGSGSTFTVLEPADTFTVDLSGAVVRITEGPGRGQTRLIDAASSTPDTLVLFNGWNQGSAPGAGSRFVIVRDDGIRSMVSENVSDTFQDFRARFPIAVGGLVGATLTITDGTGAQESKIIVANTVDTITVALDSPWTVAFAEGSGYEVTRGGEVVEVNDLPVAGTVTSIVTKTFSVTGAAFDPTVFSDGAVEENGLRAAVIEIVGGTGIGQTRVIESSTTDSITVTTPWRTELDATSEFVISRYDGLALPSVKVRVEDNDAPGVVVTQTADSTDVMENSLAAGTVSEAADPGSSLLTDSTAAFPDGLTGYVLITGGSGAGQIKSIGSNTSDTITVTSPWTEALDDTSQYKVVRDFAPWVDTYSAVLARMPEFSDTPPDQQFVRVTLDLPDSQLLVTSQDPRFDTDASGRPVLTFDAANWDTPVILTVLAVDDGEPEGFHHGYIAHAVQSADADRVSPPTTDRFPQLADEPQTSVMLMHDPIEVISVEVDLQPRDPDRYELSSSTVIFLDENGAPEEVRGEVAVTYSYLMPGYDGLEVDRVVANVGDDDAPGVLIAESDGSTDLIEIADRTGTITGTVQEGADRLIFGDFGDLDLTGMFILLRRGTEMEERRSIVANTPTAALVDLPWDTAPDDPDGFVVCDSSEQEVLTGAVSHGIDVVLAGSFEGWDLQGQTVTITSGSGEGQENTVLAASAVGDLQFLIMENPWGAEQMPDATSQYQATVALEGVPWDDSYTVSLTKEPVGEVWVTVKPEITKTTREKIRYDDIQVIVQADPTTSPDAQYGTVVERFDGVDITIPFVKLRFDSSNWNKPQTVLVTAIDDPVADGGDTKVFAPRPHTVNDIMGPLFLQGAGGQGSLVGLTPPVLLPADPFDPNGLAETNLKQATGQIAVPVTGDGTELVVYTEDIAEFDSLVDRTVEITEVHKGGPEAAVDQFRLILNATDNGDGTTTLTLNDPWDVDPGQLRYLSKYAITNQSLNFFVDEDVQVDFLTVYHDDSVANNIGSLIEAGEADRIRGYEQRITGLGMGPDILIGGELRPGGITFGTMEVAVVNLGSGKDTFTVESTHNRKDFTTWTMLNTGAGDDTVTVSLDADEQLAAGVVNAATAGTLTAREPVALPGGESPAGYAVMITSGAGAGQIRAVTEYDFATDTMTVNRGWTVLPEGDSQFVILSRGDGAFTLDTQAGDDTVTASGSTLPLVIFGGDGSDTITGGQGDDIIFGDRGRVDYLDESGGGVRVVTRLGSAPENITGSVIGADETSLMVKLDEDLLIGQLPTEDEGLRGLVVWINEGKGAGQSRLIVSNTGNTITVDTPWSVVPEGDSGFRITGRPSDQTDEMVREARFLFTSDPGVGGDDIIWGGMGEDVLIGGAGGDAIDGGREADLVFGDNVKLDRTEGRAGDYTSPRFRALTGSVIYGTDDADLVDDSADYMDPAGVPSWANWDILISEDARFVESGSDTIAGGADNDTIFGQGGDDTLHGDGMIEADGTLAAQGDTSADGDDYVEGNAGADTIFGGLGQDDLVGGSSDLFSLVAPALRADGADVIFGGNGDMTARNSTGDGSPEGHARDADMILGDNGDIFRLIDPATGGLYTFNYDDPAFGYSATVRIVPRAARLLDYSPGGPDYLPNAGAAGDIGAGDAVYGESGDDFVYGMTGSDVLFGDAGDDDIVGGYGNDWISGGTGQDGILGDDGRIYTSRNGLAEPLYGIGAVPDGGLDLYIATGGDIQNATINISGQLKKAVNLTPFKLGDPGEPQYAATYDPQYADDVIYGGWGGDFIHGGDGDDAISGAEALPEFYGNPSNPGDVLGYDPATGEFAAYDENDPWHKVEGFLLNFDPQEGPLDTTFDPVGTPSDGDDVIFGDLGNDWLVGGTGRDHLYGGRGDDLLNADDDHESGGVTNREPDTDPTYEDIAYGGAGRDRLIANTGGDRLIDWAGEFNTYIVPFSPFGVATVSRQLQPAVMDFLYQLSASDGADPTRASDEGSDPERNGEPYGELGLVTQQDPDWQDQTGGPDDPQPGNDGGSRDVLRTAQPDSTATAVASDSYNAFDTLVFDEQTGTFYDPSMTTQTDSASALVTQPAATTEEEDWIVEV